MLDTAGGMSLASICAKPESNLTPLCSLAPHDTPEVMPTVEPCQTVMELWYLCCQHIRQSC